MLSLNMDKLGGRCGCSAAIDIGTTTIQTQFINVDTGKIIKTYSAYNNQRVFGADVISRISAAQNGKLNELFAAINNQVENILQQFKNEHDFSIERCAVSGNSTMLHIFCGADPSGMGHAPYTPEFLEERHFKGEELSLSASQVTLLPGVSAFIGADIVAGLTYIDVLGKSKTANAGSLLFIYIGTNGEMALYTKKDKKIICCSTAAGPCFEEAQAKCGLNASEFIDTIAEMKRKNIIDETGALDDKFVNKGFTVNDVGIITQKNIREFQLAESAIYSGIKTLCKTSRVDLANIGAVYIAGGLGEYINLENAAELKLLPREFAGKTAAKINVCGNTSLKGAVQSLIDPVFLPCCREIITRAQTIDLAGDKYFTAAFEHNMWF